MLTHENVKTLNQFMDSTGALSGLDAVQAHAVIVDLVYTVDLIVEEYAAERLEFQLARPE